MNAMLLFFVLAVLVEALVENVLGGVAVAAKWKRWAALVLAMVLCAVYNADIMTSLGLPRVPYFGALLTGVLISRGANVFNDIVERVRNPTPPVEGVALPLFHQGGMGDGA